MQYNCILFRQHSLVQNTPQLLLVHCLLREKLLFHRGMNAWHYSRDLFRNNNVENLRSFLTNSMHDLILLSKRKLKSKSLKTKQKQKQQKRKHKNKD